MYEVSQNLHDNVYVTIDLDVFDPAYMPSTGTPEPDGLTYRTVLTLLKLINERHNIVGLDVVELCPNDINNAPFQAITPINDHLSHYRNNRYGLFYLFQQQTIVR